MNFQVARDHLIQQLRDLGIHDERVLAVINKIPRHLFVDKAMACHAYANHPLPIGHGQTISQPYIVAKMTQLLLADKMPRTVLEVGTGCGYQTAILAELIKKVYTIERIAKLLLQAKKRFQSLGLTNIESKYDDGHYGWASQAPFDAILVTAAANQVPKALLSQLAINGRLLLPIGDSKKQRLKLLLRCSENYQSQDFGAVTFVPLVGGQV